MTEAPILCLLDFSKAFEVAVDASNVRIGGVLSQKGHLVAYINVKLNNAKLRYSTYDKGSMLSCKLFVIGAIISFTRNLFYF